MNNVQVEAVLEECRVELDSIHVLITSLGEVAKPVPYVKKYAVIRATGSIESGFKQIIADRVDRGSHVQLKNFIARKVRNSSSNPRLEVIQTMLSEFDEDWRSRFDEKIALSDQPALKGALTQLVKARNSFAHGGGDDLPIETTIECFRLGSVVLKILDETVHEELEAAA